MTIFVGFPQLEHLLETLQEGQPVFASSIDEPQRTQDRFWQRRSYIVVSQARTDGAVYYCRIKTAARRPGAAAIQYAGSMPLDDDHAERRQRALELWTTVLAYLDNEGIETTPAVIAMPRDLALIDGGAEFLGGGAYAD